MSKFFKALEQAERDRVVREGQAPEVSRAETERVATARATEVAVPPMGTETTPVCSPAPPAGDRRADRSSNAVVREGRSTGDRRQPGRAGAEPKPAVARLHAAESTRVEEHLVSLLFPATFEAEQYRVLRHVLEQQQAASGLAVVAVTSAAVGDGKTTTAINLAGALTQAAGARVLLIDADLRRPTLAHHLGLSGPAHAQRPGLVDALVDSRFRLDDIVELRPEFNLAVVPTGLPAQAPYELLQSPRFVELLEEARRTYHYVILDTPPLVAVPDGRLISKAMDGFILVVRAHRTPRKLLEEALSLSDPQKLLGLVFNRDERPLSGYYRGYQVSHPLAATGTGRWTRLLRAGRRNGTGR